MFVASEQADGTCEIIIKDTYFGIDAVIHVVDNMNEAIKMIEKFKSSPVKLNYRNATYYRG